MLDKAQDVRANKKMEIGDYRFIPGTGICIFSGIEEIDYDGVKSNYFVLTPIDKLDSTIRKPASKWDDADYPPIADFEKIKEIFEVLSAPKQQMSGMWSRIEKDLRAKLLKPNLKETAEVIHLSLSKHRAAKSDKYQDTLYDTAPSEIALSYSARAILSDALDALVPVLQFRCGLAKKEARDMLIRAAVENNFKGHKTLTDNAKDKTGLTSKEFQEIFGERRMFAAKIVDGGSIAVMPESNDKGKSYPTQSDYDHADALDAATNLRANEIAARKKKPAIRKPRVQIKTEGRRTTAQVANDRHLSDTRKAKVLPQNQKMYDELSKELPVNANVKAVFNLAARTLENSQDFKAAAKLWLVKRAKRVTHAVMIEDLKLTKTPNKYHDGLDAIITTLKTRAQLDGLKAIEKVNFTTSDKIKSKKSYVEKHYPLPVLEAKQSGQDVVFSVTVPSELLEQAGGVKLQLSFGDQSIGVVGKITNVEGAKKRLPSIQEVVPIRALD